MKKFHIKKGDTVYVNAGNDKGKTGRVLEMITDKDRAIVEGVNIQNRIRSILREASLNKRRLSMFQTFSLSTL